MTYNSRVAAPRGPAVGRAVIVACLIIVSSVVVGLAAGLAWAAVAPRVVYQVYGLNPPTAYAVNPETSAFIAADGWYCLLAVAGGAVIGLVGYVYGVRRYGPLPMVGVVLGSIGAAFICAWLGHRQSGGPGFDHLLATSKSGTLLRAPISLGSHGAVAFWPLAAAAVAGGIELLGVRRAQTRSGDGGVPMPGMDTFGLRSYSDQASSAQPNLAQGRPDGLAGPGSASGSGQPDDQHPGIGGGGDPFGGESGRAAL
jgi:hypothetical protein